MKTLGRNIKVKLDLGKYYAYDVGKREKLVLKADFMSCFLSHHRRNTHSNKPSYSNNHSFQQPPKIVGKI